MNSLAHLKPENLHTSLAGVLEALQAAGEITRLRILTLLSEAELTVSDLVTILGQSQPRVSRHLRLLVEAGMVERHREGSWAFFHIAQSGPEASIARNIVHRLAPGDPVTSTDRSRLVEVRRTRAARANEYFAVRAETWKHLRSLHVPEEQVEATIRDIVGDAPVQSVLDLGTGTGRMLEVLAPLADKATGIDQSHAMLNIARSAIEREGLRNVQLRQGDLYALPVDAGSYDLVIIHMVLHFLDDPARALREAARCLRPGGRLLVVDFAPHSNERLRDEHQHRRLGFAEDDIASVFREIGVEICAHTNLVPARDADDQLTVSIWVGRDPRLISDDITGSSAAIA